MFNPLTASCPVCGAFRRGLDPIGMVVFLGCHQLATVLADDEYDRLVADTLDMATEVVS